MEICAKEACTGCGACENICPVSAISMIEDRKGFPHPVIDTIKCISCQKCCNVCPQNISPQTNQAGTVFAALAKNDSLRENSSSGGVFSLLAEWIIGHNGIVFGAAYDENLTVKHIAVSNMNDLVKLRGSKYVQSQTGHTYHEVQTALEADIRVLYSGTPCQIAGLRAFLGKSYKNLLTVDILCHGTPSPAVFRKYTDDICQAHQCEISDINFRSKVPGWKDFTTQIVLTNGVTYNYYRDSYMDGFLRNIYLRDSCYQCPYASSIRVGDITLGDYWGYQETAPHFLEDDDRGISLVMVNTPAGKQAFRRIRNQLVVAPRTLADAQKGNPVLVSPFPAPEEAKEFWRIFYNCSWTQLCETFHLDCTPIPDSLSPKIREYFAIPFCKRRPGHIIDCCRAAIVRRLKRK